LEFRALRVQETGGTTMIRGILKALFLGWLAKRASRGFGGNRAPQRRPD
jgi:hypothetical protein